MTKVPTPRLAALIITLFGCTPLESDGHGPSGRPASRPRLVVVCVVDQMKDEYLDRFKPAFGDGGFRRLLKEGTRWTHCNYPYAATETGPGHATIGSGRLPRHHGIVANEWYVERPSEKGKEYFGPVYCCDDLTFSYRVVYPSGEFPKVASAHTNFRGENLATAVKRAIPGSKVFSMSIKDRAAILMGGESADAAFWMEPDVAESRPALNYTFVSSTRYFGTGQAGALPSWMRDFMKKEIAAIPEAWTLPADASLFANRALCTEDDVPWEGGPFSKRSFPHELRVDGQPGWDRILASPVPMTMLTDLALEWIARADLGADDSTDVLFISYSSTDTVGHSFGPQSQEVLAMYDRLDRELARLLSTLDQRVGRSNYLFALTADHGVCDVPENMTNARDAGRFLVYDKNVRGSIGKALAAEFGKLADDDDDWIRKAGDAGWYLNRKTLKHNQIEVEVAAEKLREILQAQPGVQRAFTQADLKKIDPKTDDPVLLAFHRSFDSKRSGDVMIQLKPGWLPSEKSTYVTTHGTPNEYDTHVPMILCGGPVGAGGTNDAGVTPLDLVPTVAAILQIDPPKDCDGSVLPESGAAKR
jgi:arylsulfatase A-like enzyme